MLLLIITTCPFQISSLLTSNVLRPSSVRSLLHGKAWADLLLAGCLLGWKVPYYGSSFKAIDVIIYCFEIVIVYSRTLTTLSSPSAIKLSSAQLKYKLQCGVSLMSSGAKYAPYVFDFKSVLKAHKCRPVHYSLFKLKKIRSGLADAVTYLTLFLFFFLEVLVELKTDWNWLIIIIISPVLSISLSLASWWWGLWTGKEAQCRDFQSHNSDWEWNVQEVEY